MSQKDLLQILIKINNNDFLFNGVFGLSVLETYWFFINLFNLLSATSTNLKLSLKIYQKKI